MNKLQESLTMRFRILLNDMSIANFQFQTDAEDYFRYLADNRTLAHGTLRLVNVHDGVQLNSYIFELHD